MAAISSPHQSSHSDSYQRTVLSSLSFRQLKRVNTFTKRHNAIINTHNTLEQETETDFFLCHGGLLGEGRISASCARGGYILEYVSTSKAKHTNSEIDKNIVLMTCGLVLIYDKNVEC